MLEFDTTNSALYNLYKDNQVADNFNISPYPGEDEVDPKNRSGFKLNINDAGPHTYKFVYRTYYTVKGMQEPELANDAKLIFLDGDGKGIGDSIDVDFDLDGPLAGIEKSGRYIRTDGDAQQQIQWTVTFNESKILLDKGSKLTDNFTSKNYTYIDDSLKVTGIGKDDYTFTTNSDRDGFVLTLDKATNATITIEFKTTTDDEENKGQTNEATLEWQGGVETSNASVGKRSSGINKSGKVVINDDGSKTVNWTVNFNTNRNVVFDLELVDSYTPTNVIVSDIKITSGGADVTDDFTISDERTGGTFTVKKDKLDAKVYQLTYSTTLSPKEEQQEIRNTATATYRGGSNKAEETIPSPTLGVQKEAVNIVKSGIDSDKADIINWKITANTDTAKYLVNLVDPVLTDTIPEDQKLVDGSINVKRVGDLEFTLGEGAITSSDNEFSIDLPDGAYQYIVTFQTEILEYPSVTGEIGKYTNETTLSNEGYDDVSDDAWIDYFADGTNNNNAKEAQVNDDTENIDWQATVNPLGLTINNAKITDTLSKNQAYLIDDDNKIVVKAGDDELTEGSDYTLVVKGNEPTKESKPSFTITFKNESNNKNGTINKPITVLYSTRLNPDLIGKYTVSNEVKLTGGESNKELSTITKEETTSQWSFGGGGSGRLLDFDISKVTPNETPLKDAKFKLERLDLSGIVHTVSEEFVTTESIYEFEDLRAGRYILTETSAPERYKQLDNPIYFTAGYTETEGVYEVKIMNKDWKEKNNPNVSVEGNKLTITNDYKPISQGFEVSKKLTGLELTADQFDFELLDSSRNVVASAKNDAEGKITFDEQSFNESGNYKFTIREVNGGLGGIDYDDNELEVQVKVIEGDNGLEIESVNYSDGTEFTNTYTPEKTYAVIEASKKLEGQKLEEGQFEFELLDSDREVLETVSNKSNGTISFEAITYEEAGEYDYTVREVQGDLDGITYDEREFKVTVTVTDDKEGQLHSAITKYVEGPVQFTNSYEAGPGSIVLEAEKTLNGKVLLNDHFEFELVNEEDEVVQTVTNNANGQVIFEEIEFDEEGTYKYIIREKSGELGGITYDEVEYPVTVTVEDGGEGFLIPTANYGEGPAVFTNKYNAAPDSIVIEVEKILEGQELIKDQFTFTLADESGEIIETVTNNAEGQVIFREIEYDEVGEYTYIIEEVEGDQGGVTYDTTSYKVIVDVVDDGEGNLVANANYIDGPAVFTNKYTPEPDSVVLEASKSLSGQNLRRGQFTFKLLDDNDKVIQTKENNRNGQIIFDKITYESAGEFKYTITEQKGSQRGMAYDDSEYQVIVTVTDDGEGLLTATVEYEEESIEFNNRYNPPSTPPTRPTEPTDPEGRIRILKKAYGTNDLLKDAEFNIVNSRGRIVDTLRTDSKGEARSKYIPYGEYTIEEARAPRGYIILDDDINIRISSEGTEEIVVYNYKDDPEDPEVPEPEDPKDPEEPEDPTDPEDPDTPVDPEDPEDPKDPKDPNEETDIDGDKPGDRPDVDPEDPSDGKPSLPTTGSKDYIGLYILGAISILAGLFLRKKTREDS